MTTTDIATFTFNFSEAHTCVAHILHVIYHGDITDSDTYATVAAVATDTDLFETLRETYKAKVIPMRLPRDIAGTLAAMAQPVSRECMYTVSDDGLLTITTCFEDMTATDDELAFEYHVQSAMNIANGHTYQPD